MAKSKYAPALFEVINSQRKDSERLAVPKWFKRAQMAAQVVSERSSPETGRSTATSGPEGGDIPRPVEGRPAPDTAASSEPSGAATSERPTIAWHGKLPLIQLSADGIAMFFNPMNVAVTAGLLVLALFVSFLAGMAVQSRSKSVPVDPNGVQALQGQPRTPGVLGGSDASSRSPSRSLAERSPTSAPSGGEPRGPAGAAGAADPSRHEAGVNVILIETFKPDDKKSGECVQSWLASEYGLETRLDRSSKGWRLLTTKGFDYREANAEKAARDFCESVKGVGEQCAKELSRKKLPVYRLNSPMPLRADK
ncbi:MAG TPA: hypothetical protein PKY77_23470 [Phycisphaerae bacterium]|nr:hypothetical protein [Phycisphaerae bacterium]HRY71076.1 hypothetical protein [Phycisphaerae bacterium]HSA29749.1 hypothetical protein [Phycisphaerae bacterium]